MFCRSWNSVFLWLHILCLFPEGRCSQLLGARWHSGHGDRVAVVTFVPRGSRVSPPGRLVSSAAALGAGRCRIPRRSGRVPVGPRWAG